MKRPVPRHLPSAMKVVYTRLLVSVADGGRWCSRAYKRSATKFNFILS